MVSIPNGSRGRSSSSWHAGMRNLPRWKAAATLCAALAPALAAAQQAPEQAADDGTLGRPKWEAGAALLGGRVPDYPGSDKSRGRGLVAPLFIYRGPVLRIDEGGVRGRVFHTPDLEFDLTATAAFNARNNDARQGMPDLDYLFGVGPQLVYKGLRDLPGKPTLHLKLRALLSTNFHHLDSRGYTFDPELRWNTRPWASDPRWQMTLSLQPTWATRALHRYFYQVDASQATASRPAYDARGGYLGTEAAITLTRRQNERITWFVTARALSLHGSANADSPLFKARSNLSMLAGVAWTPWQSEERASR